MLDERVGVAKPLPALTGHAVHAFLRNPFGAFFALAFLIIVGSMVGNATTGEGVPVTQFLGARLRRRQLRRLPYRAGPPARRSRDSGPGLVVLLGAGHGPGRSPATGAVAGRGHTRDAAAALLPF